MSPDHMARPFIPGIVKRSDGKPMVVGPDEDAPGLRSPWPLDSPAVGPARRDTREFQFNQRNRR